MFNTAINVIPSVLYWAWDKISHKEIKQVDPVAVCGLFALIPVLPPRTRFGILDGGKVIVQLEEPIGTLPIFNVEITKQALKRTSNRDNRDEIRWFEEAIKSVNRDYGKNRIVQKLLQRTAEGVQVYAGNYKETDLAFGCLKSLAEILQESAKASLPYRPIGLASVLDLDLKIAKLKSLILAKGEVVEDVVEETEEQSLPENNDEQKLQELFEEIEKIIDAVGLNDANLPIDRDRLEAILRGIEHVYDRAEKKIPCGAELSAALTYLNCIQEDESSHSRQNPKLEVPT